MMKTRGLSTTWWIIIGVIIVVVVVGAAVAYYYHPTAKKKPLVIYELISYTGNSYFQIMINGSKYAAAVIEKEYGVPVELIVEDADNTLSTQVTQFQAATAAHPDCILVNPVSPSSEVSYAQSAESAGIFVLSLDRGIPGTPYVGSNNTQLGIMDAEALIQFLEEYNYPKPWRIVFIEGPPSTGVGYERNTAIMSVLEPFIKNGTIQIIAAQNGEFLSTTAYTIMQDVLATTHNITAVITANGLEAEGAAQALMAAGIPIGPPYGVIITAIDFTPDVAYYISKGWIQATAGQSPWVMGYWGVMLCYFHVYEHYTPPQTIITTSAVVTASNLTQGYYTLQGPVNLANYVPGAPSTPVIPSLVSQYGGYYSSG